MTDETITPEVENDTTPIPVEPIVPVQLTCTRCEAKWYSQAEYDLANPETPRLCPVCTSQARVLEYDGLREAQTHGKLAAEALLIAANMREGMGDESAARDAATYRAIAMLCSGQLDDKLMEIIEKVPSPEAVDLMFDFASHFHPSSLARLIVNEPPAGVEEEGQ